MRVFNEFEKLILRRAIDLDRESGSLITLSNLLTYSIGYNQIPSYCYISIDSPDDVNIMLLEDEFNKVNPNDQLTLIKEIDYKIAKLLLTVISLFDYLEKQRLIFFTGDFEISHLGIKVENMVYVKCDFLENDIKALVYNYGRKRLFVSETLKFIVSNGFKTTEDLKIEHDIKSTNFQLRLTQIGMIIALLALFATICLPIFYTCTVKIANESININIDGDLTKTINRIESDIANMKAIISKKQRN